MVCDCDVCVVVCVTENFCVLCCGKRMEILLVFFVCFYRRVLSVSRTLGHNKRLIFDLRVDRNLILPITKTTSARCASTNDFTFCPYHDLDQALTCLRSVMKTTFVVELSTRIYTAKERVFVIEHLNQAYSSSIPARTLTHLKISPDFAIVL